MKISFHKYFLLLILRKVDINSSKWYIPRSLTLPHEKFRVKMQIVIVFFLESNRVIYHSSDVLLQIYLVFVGLPNDMVKLRLIFDGSIKN